MAINVRQVNNYTADATGCAPTYLTVGDGGNAERV